MEYVHAFDKSGLVFGGTSLSYDEIASYGSAKNGVMNSNYKNTFTAKVVATDFLEKN